MATDFILPDQQAGAHRRELVSQNSDDDWTARWSGQATMPPLADYGADTAGD